MSRSIFGANFISGVPVTRGPFAAEQEGNRNRAITEGLEFQNEMRREAIDYLPIERQMAEETHSANVEAHRASMDSAEEERAIRGLKSFVELAPQVTPENYGLYRDRLSELSGLDMPKQYDPKVFGGARAIASKAAEIYDAAKYYREIGDPKTAEQLEKKAEAAIAVEVANAEYRRAAAENMGKEPSKDKWQLATMAGEDGEGLYRVNVNTGETEYVGGGVDKPDELSVSEAKQIQIAKDAIPVLDRSISKAEEAALLVDSYPNLVGIPGWFTRAKETVEGYGNPDAEQPAKQLRDAIATLTATNWKELVGTGQISGGDYIFLSRLIGNPEDWLSDPAEIKRKMVEFGAWAQMKKDITMRKIEFWSGRAGGADEAGTPPPPEGFVEDQ